VSDEVSRLRRLRRFEWARARSRPVKALAGIAVTALCAGYILWQIDVSKTIDILRNASWGYFLGAIAIMGLSVWPMAWRWQRLLLARGIHDRLNWLVRTYFVSYTAGQVLPTSIGGDAARIYETSKRHPGQGAPVTGSVLLERALGGAATLMLAAIGFVLALGHYDVGGYIWVELAFVLASGVAGFALFSRRARGSLGRTRPLLAKLKLERPLRAAYEGIHGYRDHVGLMIGVMILTLGVQAVRVLAIWMAGKAVGVDLSPRPYYVMGPLLFLVMLVPFTINGLAVREAFFVSFLSQLGVDKSAAFATGFLFFVVTIALALPGAAILAWQSFRPATPTVPDG
jgi:glycosyltransferase 2 family protein